MPNMPDSEPKFTPEHRIAYAICVAAAFPLLDAIVSVFPAFGVYLSPIAAIVFVITLCVVVLARDSGHNHSRRP